MVDVQHKKRVKFAWSGQEDVWLFPDDASFEQVLDNTDRCLSGHVRICCVLLFVAKALQADLTTTTFGVCKW